MVMYRSVRTALPRVACDRCDAAPSPRTTRTAPSSRAAAVVLPSGELKILPRHALVLLARIAQEERRMEGRDQHRRAVRMHAAAELADRLSGAEEALSRDAAERQDDLGLQHRQLRREERRAGGELVGLGISIPGRPTHDGVANVDFVARQLDLSRLEHFRQELSRPPDEGEALSIFVGRAGQLLTKMLEARK